MITPAVVPISNFGRHKMKKRNLFGKGLDFGLHRIGQCGTQQGRYTTWIGKDAGTAAAATGAFALQ
eukprot:scaffold4850_cov50-Attheya_sp.AAC.10